MSYRKELWEDTHMSQRAYPIQLFQNRPTNKKIGDCILYLHWHAHLELIIVKSGQALFYIDSQPIEARTGDVLLVPGGSLHVGYSQSEEKVEIDCIVFNPALFQEWMDDSIHVQLLSMYLEGKNHFPYLVSKEPYFSVELQEELKRVTDELLKKEAGYQLIVKAKLYAWLVQLARNHKQPSKAQEPYFANRDRFKQLIKWVKLHYAEKPTVKQAAAMVGLDPYYFCKQFKKLTGRTFIEYVNICRLTEAERMLKYSEETISEIASSIGCENAAYFTKLYKQYMGMTPSDARKGKHSS
ncbi:AraC family transcriptional regulator [Paenibacillus septentrionalis]|uniref:AraC family transcriptional regulator n=1 Tax=Paenibacillus septentrionalis TaxID=429342 RepID=A0ABW1V367_9BACL